MQMNGSLKLHATNGQYILHHRGGVFSEILLHDFPLPSNIFQELPTLCL